MRILLTGASGHLGSYLLRELSRTDHSVVAWSGSTTGNLFGCRLRPIRLEDPADVASAFREARPDVAIHAAAIGSIAACYSNPALAHRVNAVATGQLAELCSTSGARLVHVSTDLVFDGEQAPYTEQAATTPLSEYGRSKAAAERLVLDRAGCVVRVSLLFGPTLTGRPTFFDQQLAALRDRQPLRLFEDEWRTPLSLVTAATGLLQLAESEFPADSRTVSPGIVHLGGPERMSRMEMGLRLAESVGGDPAILIAAQRHSAAAPERRPRDTSLDSSLWRRRFPEHPWPTWTAAVRELGFRSASQNASSGLDE